MSWAAIHSLYLAQTGQRLSVWLQWMWTFLTGQRGSRLIVNHHGPAVATHAEAGEAKELAHHV